MGSLKFKNMPPGKAAVSKEIKDDKTGTVEQSNKDELVNAPHLTGPSIELAPVPFAEIGYAAGFTQNLGNFSSARCEISIRLPCPPDQIDETYEFAMKWVSDRLQSEAASLENS
jgi:hypothetical protein